MVSVPPRLVSGANDALTSYRRPEIGPNCLKIVLSPLKEDPPNQIIVDLKEVNYFGSAFITFLLRCHLMVKNRGSELVLAGVNPQIRELLRTTALDTLWALYDTANEAVEALGGVD